MKILGGGGGGAPKIFRHPKGGSEKIVGLGGEAPNICILQNQQERGGRGALLKNETANEGGLLKFQALSFNIFIPLVILNGLSLNCK